MGCENRRCGSSLENATQHWNANGSHHLSDISDRQEQKGKSVALLYPVWRQISNHIAYRLLGEPPNVNWDILPSYCYFCVTQLSQSHRFSNEFVEPFSDRPHTNTTTGTSYYAKVHTLFAIHMEPLRSYKINACGLPLAWNRRIHFNRYECSLFSASLHRTNSDLSKIVDETVLKTRRFIAINSKDQPFSATLQGTFVIIHQQIQACP